MERKAMDKSGFAAVMLLATILLPLAIGLAEAYRKGRGVAGWIVSGLVSTAGGVALLFAVINAPGMPPIGYMSEPMSAAIIFGCLIFGAVIALWIVNRVRA
jgi:hypothetical protein